MKVIIAAAGTAGHINPGLAIGNIIKNKYPSSDIRFICTRKKLEKDLLNNAGYKFYEIDAYGFSKKLNIENIKKDIKTLKGFKEARKILKEFKPDLVIGMRGYICGSVIYEAHKLKIKTMLHESNAYPGLAIRMLQKYTDTIMVGINDAKNYLKKAKRVVYTGNPTKIKKNNISLNDKEKILKELKLNNKLPIVLVFGGSQGAKKINDTIIDLLKNNLNTNYQIILSTRKNQYDYVIDNLKNYKINNTIIKPYIYNMDEVMNISDLIVARSGAMTLTEIALLSKPSILIPLPSSTMNRQEDNARVFEKNNAAKVILNNNLNKDNLNEEINDIIKSKIKLKNMSISAEKLAVYDVQDRIYNEIERLIND